MAGVDGRSITAQGVAEYLLAYTDREAGETISNLKLQKLVYYSQGFCVAMRGSALFSDPIQAWDHGPVVRSVYDDQKHNGWRSIDPPACFEPDSYLPEDRELLDAILVTYGQLSATRLRDMTHKEPPWVEAYRPGENIVITIEAMHSYFRSLADAGDRGESIQGHPVWATAKFRHQGRRRIDARMEPHRERLREIARARVGPSGIWSADED